MERSGDRPPALRRHVHAAWLRSVVGAAEAIDHSRRMRGKGVAGGEPAIAWNELIRFKRTFTEPVPPIKSFAKNGAALSPYAGTERLAALPLGARARRSDSVPGGRGRPGRGFCRMWISPVLVYAGPATLIASSVWDFRNGRAARASPR